MTLWLQGPHWCGQGQRIDSYVKGINANVYDVVVVPELLTGKEEVVYGDRGYLGAENGRTP